MFARLSDLRQKTGYSKPEEVREAVRGVHLDVERRSYDVGMWIAVRYG